MRDFRTDTSRLARFPRNGAGSVRVPATIARTGVQVRNGVREYRSPDQVFADASVASLASVPVTLNHPDDDVTPANIRQHMIGHVTDQAPEARVKVDGSRDEWLKTTLIVSDADALAAIDADEAAEVSCGYYCDMTTSPGVSPAGEPYDVLVSGITYNHVAILTKDTRARAGAEAKLRLDSKTMKIVLIDGVEYEFGTEKHIAKLQTDAAAAVTSATARADKTEAERDAAKDALKAAQASLNVDAVDARVEARLTLLQRAAKLLSPAYDTKGKSDAQVRKDAVSAKIGADKLADKSDVYVEARFDQLTEDAGTDAATFHNPRKDGTPAPRAQAVSDSDEAFRASLAKKDETK